MLIILITFKNMLTTMSNRSIAQQIPAQSKVSLDKEVL